MRGLVTSLTVAMCVMAAPLVAQEQGAKKAAKAPSSRTARISGNASSLASCVVGHGYNTHALGWAPRGTRITVDLEGNDGFDGMATAVVLQMGRGAGDNARVQYAFSDDGDALDPRLEINLENDANVSIHVGSYDEEPGCYFLKVDVRLP